MHESKRSKAEIERKKDIILQRLFVIPTGVRKETREQFHRKMGIVTLLICPTSLSQSFSCNRDSFMQILFSDLLYMHFSNMTNRSEHKLLNYMPYTYYRWLNVHIW